MHRSIFKNEVMALPRTVSGLRRFEAIIQLKLKAGLPLSEEQKAYLNSAVSREELEAMQSKHGL